MNLEKLIEHFSRIEPFVWKNVAMKVSWHYRTGGEKPMPPLILAAFGGIPERGVWDAIREGVAAKRRLLKFKEKQYEETQRKERRRKYMKEYMRDRRIAERKAREQT